jgi:hypothetical protein
MKRRQQDENGPSTKKSTPSLTTRDVWNSLDAVIHVDPKLFPAPSGQHPLPSPPTSPTPPPISKDERTEVQALGKRFMGEIFDANRGTDFMKIVVGESLVAGRFTGWGSREPIFYGPDSWLCHHIKKYLQCIHLPQDDRLLANLALTTFGNDQPLSEEVRGFFHP